MQSQWGEDHGLGPQPRSQIPGLHLLVRARLSQEPCGQVVGTVVSGVHAGTRRVKVHKTGFVLDRVVLLRALLVRSHSTRSTHPPSQQPPLRAPNCSIKPGGPSISLPQTRHCHFYLLAFAHTVSLAENVFSLATP